MSDYPSPYQPPIVGIVAIAMGMTSACCMPAAIPLLIFWINDKTRKYFGM